MVRTNYIRGKMVMCGYNIQTLSEAMNISSKTLSSKLQTGNFSIEEAEKLIKLLQIEAPGDIFFAI